MRKRHQVIIIGGGPAGVFAAIEAKRRDPQAEVALLSEEPCEPYERPPLSKAVLLGKAKAGDAPIADLQSPVPSLTLQQLERMMLRDANRLHADARPDDANVRARAHSFDVAAGLMREAPQVFDLSGESDETLRLYGLPRGDNRSCCGCRRRGRTTPRRR